MAIELHRRTELLQVALVQHGNAVAHRHRFHLVMGDIERGGTEAALQGDDLGAGAIAQLGVEVAEGLIHQEHRGLAGDCPPQGHPLLLPPRQFFGEPIKQGIQLQQASHLGHPGLDTALPQRRHLQALGPAAGQLVEGILELLGEGTGPTAPQPKADVVPHTQVGIEGIALKHHGNVPLRGPQPHHRAPPNPDHSAAGGLQASQKPQ